jgi:hypothetical protein
MLDAQNQGNLLQVLLDGGYFTAPPPPSPLSPTREAAQVF